MRACGVGWDRGRKGDLGDVPTIPAWRQEPLCPTSRWNPFMPPAHGQATRFSALAAPSPLPPQVPAASLGSGWGVDRMKTEIRNGPLRGRQDRCPRRGQRENGRQEVLNKSPPGGLGAFSPGGRRTRSGICMFDGGWCLQTTVARSGSGHRALETVQPLLPAQGFAFAAPDPCPSSPKTLHSWSHP